ncbi:MAG: hypothetical protein AAF250_04525 [Pseudomonadota bacterium]
MTTVMQSPPAQPDTTSNPTAPEGWNELRQNADIQFEPVEIPAPEPEVPSWLEQMLQDLFAFLADLMAPIGRALGISWPVLQWVLLGLVALFVLYLLYRLISPMDLQRNVTSTETVDNGWRPDRKESLALLEDADRLAAEGKFDEATHLLLQRSVGQIAAARPDWVEPSSTARELAALPALSETARGAFRVISERVERSLFALRALDRGDWEAARSAYAEFALVKIGQPRAVGTSA